MNIGNQIKSKRIEHRLSQESLAHVLGVSRQTILSWEKSRTLPDIQSLIKMADYYGISLDILLGYRMDKTQIGHSNRRRIGILLFFLSTLCIVLMDVKSARVLIFFPVFILCLICYSYFSNNDKLRNDYAKKERSN